MSVSGLITFGVGPKGSVPFILTEGLSPRSAPPSPTLKHHPGGRWLTKKEREALHAKALAELARQEAMWADDAKEQDELRGQLLDALHPERVVIRERERERMRDEILDLDFDREDEEDVEFLLLHA